MKIEEAEALHVELLQSLPGTGNATSALTAVVELHRPVRDGRDSGCDNCVTWLEERAPWPCRTISAINTYAHVSGIPTTAEEREAMHEARYDA